MTVPAGWYRDPWGQAGLRWWDGGQWTAFTEGPAPPGGNEATGQQVAPALHPASMGAVELDVPSYSDVAVGISGTGASFTTTGTRVPPGISDDLVVTDEFASALTLLAGGCHVFLTGKAGTGKSTLIRQFMRTTDRNVVVLAPTGIAALNVNGYTIHRLFSFRTTTTLDDVRSGDYRPMRFAKTLASLDTLIIDEASMVRADLFDMLAAALERFGPRPREPFGGVQVVLVGDLYQLPPVVTEAEAAYFSTRYKTPYFFSADSFQRDHFPTIALTTVFRQLGDERMTSILNDIREGVLVGHAHDQLNARTDPDFVPPDGESGRTSAPTNKIVSARNRQHLERLPGDEVVHPAPAGPVAPSLFEPPAEEDLRFNSAPRS